jgi:hypothetical protein
MNNPQLILLMVLDGGLFVLIIFSNVILGIYLLYKKEDIKLNRIKEVLSQKSSSIYEKIKRFHLYFFILAPNLVLVNNGLHPVLKILLSILFVFLGSSFPMFYVIFLCHSLCSFYSFIFGYLYEKTEWFPKKINQFYFKYNSEKEIHLILTFFFGNMYRSAQHCLTGSLGGSLYYYKKRDEINQSYSEAHSRVSLNPTRHSDYESFREAVREEQSHILRNEALIHSAENKFSTIILGFF